MKKLLVFMSLLIFTTAAFAEQYMFSAGAVDEIDIVMTVGTLNLTSGKTKSIIIDITPDKPENTQRHIRIDEDKDLKVYLDDATVTEDTVVNITVPKSKNDIEINSVNAEINAAKLKGSLGIDASGGSVNVKDFIGDFSIDTIDAEVKAEGIFKELDIETSNGHVDVTFRKIPSLYDYSVEGAGKVTLRVPSGFTKARLKLDRKEFYGTLNID